MTAPRTDVCSAWADDSDLCSPLDDYGIVVPDDMYLGASNILYELTGSRWPGSCEDTVRPCAQQTDKTWRPIRAPVGGQVGSVEGSCGCQEPRGCGCGGFSAVDLGVYPLVSIDELLIDGNTIDASLYAIHDYRWLVWTDPQATKPANTNNIRTLPCCQDLWRDPTEDNTWEVTFTYGTAPPEPGPQAAAELAGELYLACQPETAGQCRLPAGLQQLTRQGATLQIQADEDDLMGLPTVRRFLQAYRRTPGGSVLIPGRNRKVSRVTG